MGLKGQRKWFKLLKMVMVCFLFFLEVPIQAKQATSLLSQPQSSPLQRNWVSKVTGKVQPGFFVAAISTDQTAVNHTSQWTLSSTTENILLLLLGIILLLTFTALKTWFSKEEGNPPNKTKSKA
jgi:hypothetical protein